MTNTTDGVVVKLVAKIPKKSSKRSKPKDKPKRPLSAYNFFFKAERANILKALNDTSGAYDKDEALNKLRKSGGKVSFEEMGKLIGRRWKQVDQESHEAYSKLAGEDSERYKKEMLDYNDRQEAKMLNDSVKPTSNVDIKAAKGTASSGYSQGMSAFNPPLSGYPYAMDYGAYGMAPMMYTPYYGGPPPPPPAGGPTGGGGMYGTMGYGYTGQEPGQPYSGYAYGNSGDAAQWAGAGQE